MKNTNKFTSRASILLGALILVIAILGVMLIKLKPKPPAEEVFVRPLKTYEIGKLETISSWKYTGKIRPDEQVDMSFEVNGTVTDLLVKKGEKVKKGQLLAKLDPRDFQNAIDAGQARKDRAKAYLDRIKKALDMNAVSQQDYDDALAQHDVAVAELEIKQKALEDTELHASFDGTIADTYIDQFQNVVAKQKILTLHDVTTIEVLANVAEKRVIFSSEDETNNYRHTAVFDFIPGKEFDLTLKEFSTEADPETQTYQVTFTMPQPDNVMLLGGMSTTVYEYQTAEQSNEHAGYLAPLTAVPIDAQGNYYVWKIKDIQGKTQVERTEVKVGTMSGNKVLILDGVQKGELIAAAGVHFLREGQHVRLMK
jgi:RND family efflux transporter MFP subunit